MDVNHLSRLEIFDKLHPQARNGLASLLQERKWKKGAMVIRQGMPSNGVFVILAGSIQITRVTEGGAHVILNTIKSGQMFGTLSSLDGGPRGADCIAKTDVHAAFLPRQEFVNLMKGKSMLALGFQVAVIRSIFSDIRRTNEQLAELSALEPLEDIALLED